MRVHILNPGHDWNPLRAHRNLPCPCGSDKKVKRCHGLALTVPTDVAATLRKYLRALSAAGVITARPKEIT